MSVCDRLNDSSDDPIAKSLKLLVEEQLLCLSVFKKKLFIVAAYNFVAVACRLQ